jgi:hypothetical protein
MKKFNRIATILIFFISVCLFFSCSKECCKDTFKRGDISFKIPEDWKIGEIDSSDASFFFIAIGKEGHGASADAFIEWNKGKFHLDSVMLIRQQDYMSQKVYQNGKIEFTEIKEEKFAGFDALSTTFTFSSLDVKYLGKIQCFYLPECDKTVMIAFQQVAADADKQKSDYDLIEKSFNCNK